MKRLQPDPIIVVFILLSACVNSDLSRTVEPYSIQTPSKVIDLAYSTPTKTAASDTVVPTTVPMQSTPTPSLSQSGPWLLLRSGKDLLIVNNDGSALVRLDIQDLWLDWNNSFSAATNDGMVAIKNMNDELFILTIPELSIEPITHVINPDTDFSNEDHVFWEDTYASIYFLPNMAWSSSGEMLAYVATVDGRSPDLYLYDLVSKEITRLTTGTTIALLPEWSPDHDFIVHDAVTGVYWGSSGRGYSIASVWAAPPDGSIPYHLFESQLAPGKGFEHRLGWLSGSVYLASTEPEWCNQTDLRTVSLAGASSMSLWEGSFFDAVFDPRSKTILVFVPLEEYQWSNEGCDRSNEPGFYLVSLETGGRSRIEGLDLSNFINPTITWSSNANLFLIEGAEGLYSVNLKGKAEDISTGRFGIPHVSSDGQYWAMLDQAQYPNTGIIIKDADGTSKKVFIGEVGSMSWSPGSNNLFFTGRESDDVEFLSLYISEEPSFIPKNLSERYSLPGDWWFSFLTWANP